MDESYMREYFERNQEVFYMRFRKDESKWALEKERAQAVDSFREKYVHGEAMEADFEAIQSRKHRSSSDDFPLRQ